MSEAISKDWLQPENPAVPVPMCRPKRGLDARGTGVPPWRLGLASSLGARGPGSAGQPIGTAGRDEVPALAARLNRWVLGWICALEAAAQRRRDRRLLGAMSDRELSDIGIGRGGIDGAVQRGRPLGLC